MKSEKNKSVGLLIRRFIAGLIFLSVISELIEDISTGNFSGRSLDDLFFGLIIVFFLAFSSRKNKKPKVTENEELSKKIDSISGSEEDRLEDTEIRIKKQNNDVDNTKIELEELETLHSAAVAATDSAKLELSRLVIFSVTYLCRFVLFKNV